MDIPENQHKVSLKWLYHHGEKFLLTIPLNEVVRGEKKKKDFHCFCFYKNTCVILFMVNLN